MAIIEYSFLFEPGINTWERGSEFEKDLSKFFDSHDLEATVVETFGGTGRRVIHIMAKDKLDKAREDKNLTRLPDIKTLKKKAEGKDGRK